MKPIISPRELANAIGVSESSLKRWADDGLIRVSKTAGGHRRITIGEAIRFLRTTRAPLLRPDLLGLDDLSAGGAEILRADDPAARLLAYLREGQAREARGLVLSMYLTGASVAEIADGAIRSAMETLGELWRHDADGIYVEHRATDICILAVQQLRLLVEPPEFGAIALGGAPPGDPYLLPSLLAATALAADGWRTTNLGPDTPFDALGAALERHGPRVVWLSVSAIRDARELETGITSLAHRLAEHEIALVLGGRAANQLMLPANLPARRGTTVAELVEIAGAARGEASAAARETQ